MGELKEIGIIYARSTVLFDVWSHYGPYRPGTKRTYKSVPAGTLLTLHPVNNLTMVQVYCATVVSGEAKGYCRAVLLKTSSIVLLSPLELLAELA